MLSAGWRALLFASSANERTSMLAGAIGEILLLFPMLYLQSAVVHGFLWLLGSRGRRLGETLDCACFALAPGVFYWRSVVRCASRRGV